MLSSAGFRYHCTDHTTTEDRDWTAGRRPGFWHRLAGSGALGGGQGQEAVVGPRAQTQTLLPPLSSFATLDQALGTSVAQFPAYERARRLPYGAAGRMERANTPGLPGTEPGVCGARAGAG